MTTINELYEGDILLAMPITGWNQDTSIGYVTFVTVTYADVIWCRIGRNAKNLMRRKYTEKEDRLTIKNLPPNRKHA